MKFTSLYLSVKIKIRYTPDDEKKMERDKFEVYIEMQLNKWILNFHARWAIEFYDLEYCMVVYSDGSTRESRQKQLNTT